MIINNFFRTPATGIGFGIAGVLLSVVACGFIAAHATSFSLKRDTAVMIGTTLPELRSSVALLSANSQAEQFFAQNALSAREEQASVHILPDGPASLRAVDALQTVATVLAKAMQTQGSMERLSFDQEIVNHGSYKSVRGELHLKGSFRYVARFLTILGFSGDMMVKDVLTNQQSETLLRQVEAGAPLALKTATDFLFTDLLQYAGSPDAIEQVLLKELPADDQAAVKSFLLTSPLQDARISFEDVAESLRGKRVWPLPLVRVNGVMREGDQWTIDLTFFRR